MAHVLATTNEASAFWQAAMSSGFFARTMVLWDGKVTVFLAILSKFAVTATIAEQHEAVEVVNAALATRSLSKKTVARVTDKPIVEVETTKTLIRDLLVLTPLTLDILT